MRLSYFTILFLCAAMVVVDAAYGGMADNYLNSGRREHMIKDTVDREAGNTGNQALGTQLSEGQIGDSSQISQGQQHRTDMLVSNLSAKNLSKAAAGQFLMVVAKGSRGDIGGARAEDANGWRTVKRAIDIAKNMSVAEEKANSLKGLAGSISKYLPFGNSAEGDGKNGGITGSSLPKPIDVLTDIDPSFLYEGEIGTVASDFEKRSGASREDFLDAYKQGLKLYDKGVDPYAFLSKVNENDGLIDSMAVSDDFKRSLKKNLKSAFKEKGENSLEAHYDSLKVELERSTLGGASGAPQVAQVVAPTSATPLAAAPTAGAPSTATEAEAAPEKTSNTLGAFLDSSPASINIPGRSPATISEYSLFKRVNIKMKIYEERNLAASQNPRI